MSLPHDPECFTDAMRETLVYIPAGGRVSFPSAVDHGPACSHAELVRNALSHPSASQQSSSGTSYSGVMQPNASSAAEDILNLPCWQLLHERIGSARMRHLLSLPLFWSLPNNCLFQLTGPHPMPLRGGPRLEDSARGGLKRSGQSWAPGAEPVAVESDASGDVGPSPARARKRPRLSCWRRRSLKRALGVDQPTLPEVSAAGGEAAAWLSTGHADTGHADTGHHPAMRPRGAAPPATAAPATAAPATAARGGAARGGAARDDAHRVRRLWDEIRDAGGLSSTQLSGTHAPAQPPPTSASAHADASRTAPVMQAAAAAGRRARGQRRWWRCGRQRRWWRCGRQRRRWRCGRQRRWQRCGGGVERGSWNPHGRYG